MRSPSSNGDENRASGFQALYSNTTGFDNTAIGDDALFSNIDGSNNVALGFTAGINLASGSNNDIEIGNSGVTGESNTIRIGTSGTHTATYLAGIRGVPITGGQAVGVNANGQLGVRAIFGSF